MENHHFLVRETIYFYGLWLPWLFLMAVQEKEKPPVVHQASAVRIRKKKDTAPDDPTPAMDDPTPSPVVMPAPRSEAPQAPVPQQTTWQPNPNATPWEMWQHPVNSYGNSYGNIGNYDAFSYQAYTPYQYQSFPYYQAYAPPAEPAPAAPDSKWVPPSDVNDVTDVKISPTTATPEPEKSDSEKGKGCGCEDWEELYDSEPGSTEVHSAASSIHSSPAGPIPQVKPCVAPPWLLCTSTRRRAQQKQTWDDQMIRGRKNRHATDLRRGESWIVLAK